MTESPYWNPQTETLPRDRARRAAGAQAARPTSPGRSRTRRGRAGSSGGGRAGRGHLASLDDLRRIPFMTRDEWMESQTPIRRSATVLAQPPAAAIRYHTTSGTSGSRPLACSTARRTGSGSRRCGATASGASACAPATACSSRSATARSSASGARTTRGEKIGCLVLPGGNMTTEARVRQIMAMDATVVCSTPTYALRMAQEAAALGIDLADGPVQRADPLGRARRLDPGDEAADRGAVGREGGRHGGHDRGRHDHDVRVRPSSPAARTSSRTTSSRR